MNAFALECRYPEALAPPSSQDEGARYLARASEAFACLTKP
jgi:hypothetical protein